MTGALIHDAEVTGMGVEYEKDGDGRATAAVGVDEAAEMGAVAADAEVVAVTTAVASVGADETGVAALSGVLYNCDCDWWSLC